MLVSVASGYSDGVVDAGFVQQTGVALDSSVSGSADLPVIDGDINRSGALDLLIYCYASLAQHTTRTDVA